MQDLMDFEVVSELLGLDARDATRNRLLLGAVSEQICLYLDRNLLLDSTTELLETNDEEILPHEYPVREITAIVDAWTGEALQLAPGVVLKDIKRPDAHRQVFFRIESASERGVLITYRYGYEKTEMPQLIQEAVLKMMNDRLLMYGKTTIEETQSMDKDRLMNLSPYRRLYLR